MAETRRKLNGNGRGNGSRDARGNGPQAQAAAAEPVEFRRIVVATRDLSTDECAVTLIVDGERMLSVPAVDWATAQEDALRMLTGAGEESSGGAPAS
ncbi:MAG: hypothetical protein ACK2UL_07980 [Anaerolineae bacterium]